MQDALQQGVNMHVATVASLYVLASDEVTSWQKPAGKIVNFALLYGGSPRRILEEFTKNGIPIDEAGAVEIHRKFFDTYKGFAKRKEAARVLQRLEVPGRRRIPRGALRDRAEAELRRSVWPAPKSRDTGDGRGLAPIPRHLS
jgi:DNA polymerase I-like protein with 3'-5' exonuclease and polymerase domains